METIKVSIIEDQEDYRKTLQMMVNGTSGFLCEQVHPNGEMALSGIPQQIPDIVMVDLGLPGISGTECIRQLKLKLPKIQFIVLTVKDEDDEIFDALTAGASGYLLKSTPPTKIIESIREVYDGGAPMSAQIARKVVESFRKPTKTRKNPYEDVLTKREKEVLSLLSKGLFYKQIAGELFISIETVKSHCHNIYEKLHVSTRTEALKEYYYKDFKEE
ncbi:MAG: response regulator transcription factor [Chitinophagales bacterium]|nr:response regulator transcription factor [Chitinophagales bacterium]